MHKLFLEIIIAPEFDADALEVLSKKKNLRLLQLDFTKKDEDVRDETVSIMGGLLRQEQDVIDEDPKNWEVVTEIATSDSQLVIILFTWKAVNLIKSNDMIVEIDAIVL